MEDSGLDTSLVGEGRCGLAIVVDGVEDEGERATVYGTKGN